MWHHLCLLFPHPAPPPPAHPKIPLALLLECILNPPTSLSGPLGLSTLTSHLDITVASSLCISMPHSLSPCEPPSWVTSSLYPEPCTVPILLGVKAKVLSWVTGAGTIGSVPSCPSLPQPASATLAPPASSHLRAFAHTVPSPGGILPPQMSIHVAGSLPSSVRSTITSSEKLLLITYFPKLHPHPHYPQLYFSPEQLSPSDIPYNLLIYYTRCLGCQEFLSALFTTVSPASRIGPSTEEGVQ